MIFFVARHFVSTPFVLLPHFLTKSKMLPSGLIPHRVKAPSVEEVAEPEVKPDAAKPKVFKSKKALRKGGKRCRARQKAKRQERYGVKVAVCRQENHLARLPGFHRELILPVIGQQDSHAISVLDDHSPQAMEFYESHPGLNRWVEVSERSNLSNPAGVVGGGKGLFAKVAIARGTKICPYVGHSRAKPCPAEEGCHYDMRFDKRTVICARELEYDFGYLMGFDNTTRGCRTLAMPTPPNYGRYANSANEGQEDKNNCVFEAVEDGHELIFLQADRDIAEGEELLVDYGSDFIII